MAPSMRQVAKEAPLAEVPPSQSRPPAPTWVKALVVAVAIMLVGVVILHLTGQSPGGHFVPRP